MPLSQVVRAAVPFLMALGAVRPAAGAPCAELCSPTGPTCVVGNLACDAPAIFDLGGRALVIGQGKLLQINRGDGDGVLTITGAASVTLEPDATIRAQGTDGDSGQVIIVSAGPVSLATGSRIDVSANLDGGYIEIETQTGALESHGTLQAKAGTNGEGGEVVLTAREGDVTIDGDGINCSASGELSGGGAITLEAAGDLSIRAPIDLGGGDAGELLADADGSVVANGAGTIRGIAAAAGGLGASSTVLAGNDVRLGGKITATAPGNADDGGGLGGELFVVAEAGSVELSAQVTMTGDGPDAEGGSIEATAGLDLTVSAPLLAGITGGGLGGAVTMSAGRFASFSSLVDVRADDVGGTIKLTSADSLTILGSLRADATKPTGIGGRTALRACALSLLRDGLISTTGAGTFPDASNVLESAGQLTVNGTLDAGDRTPGSGGRNRLAYRATPPVIGPGAVIAPEEDLTVDPGLPCCGDGCTTPATTTTTVVVPSSTTVTSSSTTSTPSTSVTSTSAPSAVSTTVPTPGATSTTSSTTTPASPTTTSTLEPASCLDRPLAGFDAVDCCLALLSDLVVSQPADALGGGKSARALRSRVIQAQRLVTAARGKAKPVPTLLRARKQMRSFRSLAQRGTRRRRIDPQLSARLLDLAGTAAATIDGLRASSQPERGS